MRSADLQRELDKLIAGAESRLQWLKDEGIDDTAPDVYSEHKGHLRGLRTARELMEE
jgi:hypothetical protein